ncbi:hypothetical protein CY34DRAFT_814029 [Suillus luteus UH-Slu-Lm8-n1]|uniref:Uncharacterized protein n=1 Tax=Suillus luteus UH-Slu-Lm8-n1 TaxID=930992 RepID=A0A0D0AF86_9AGAM|nr:hypothetical protein CY34DRAFT_814029 [Suillus luteus UH-Slu-Lm8-n1]
MIVVIVEIGEDLKKIVLLEHGNRNHILNHVASWVGTIYPYTNFVASLGLNLRPAFFALGLLAI